MPLTRRADSPVAIAVETAHESQRAVASEEAVRLALRLRETRSASGGRALLFVPVSTSTDVSPLVDDVVLGLLELHEGPLLVMDLRVAQAGARVRKPRVDYQDDEDAMGVGWGVGASSAVGLAHPFAGRVDTVRHAASSDFSALFARARARYAYVLCTADAIAVSVETVIAAALCDGVVLSVRPGQTTRSNMQRIADQLQRAHTHVIGFVVDARAPEKEV
jgi:hypothetical protein